MHASASDSRNNSSINQPSPQRPDQTTWRRHHTTQPGPPLPKTRQSRGGGLSPKSSQGCGHGRLLAPYHHHHLTTGRLCKQPAASPKQRRQQLGSNSPLRSIPATAIESTRTGRGTPPPGCMPHAPSGRLSSEILQPSLFAAAAARPEREEERRGATNHHQQSSATRSRNRPPPPRSLCVCRGSEREGARVPP